MYDRIVKINLSDKTMAKKSTREDLLKKGFDLFHTNGYHATGIQEITDTVGVSKGSFYNHFKKKEKFAAEMIDNFGETASLRTQRSVE